MYTWSQQMPLCVCRCALEHYSSHTQAALGMFGYMTELHTVEEQVTETIEAEGGGICSILYFHFRFQC